MSKLDTILESDFCTGCDTLEPDFHDYCWLLEAPLQVKNDMPVKSDRCVKRGLARPHRDGD